MQMKRLGFVSRYQRNKCQYKGNHILVIKGKARHALHICASCWQKDNKKLEHPECSTACPQTYKNWLSKSFKFAYKENDVLNIFPEFCERDLHKEDVEIDAKNYIIVTYQIQFFAEQLVIFLWIIWTEW